MDGDLIIIATSGINSNKNLIKGILIDEVEGMMYGDEVTIYTTIVIDTDKVINIPKDSTLIIAPGVTLTLNSIIVTNDSTVLYGGNNYGNINGLVVDTKFGEIDLSSPTPLAYGGTYTYSDGVYTILDGTNVIIYGSTTTRRIRISQGAKVFLTLDNVTITLNEAYQSAIFLEKNSTLNLTLVGTNQLVANYMAAAIAITPSTTLIIDGTGSIEAQGGFLGAGIGGYYSDLDNQYIKYEDLKVHCGTVIINSGTVVAFGGINGSGIGGGYLGNRGSITINNGIVTGHGGDNAPGIGSGARSTETGIISPITINGGIVTGYGGEFGAGIGLGNNSYDNCDENHLVLITGGNVYGYGGEHAAGIGTGLDNCFSGQLWSITINGGNVYAIGGECGAGIGSGKINNTSLGLLIVINDGVINASGGIDAAGIGGGQNGSGGSIFINGGIITAIGDKTNIGSIRVDNGATINITGGTLVASDQQYALYNNNYNDTINITGGVISVKAINDEANFISKVAFANVKINGITLLNNLFADLCFGSLVYDTLPKEPTVVLNNLPGGLEYELSYENNINSGDAKIIIRIIGTEIYFNIDFTIVKNSVIVEPPIIDIPNQLINGDDLPIITSIIDGGYYQFEETTLKLGAHSYKWEFIPTNDNYQFIGQLTGEIILTTVLDEFIDIILLIENIQYHTTQIDVTSSDEAKVVIENILSQFISNQITIDINSLSFNEATSGTLENKDGIKGSYIFTITLNAGYENEYTTKELILEIIATRYELLSATIIKLEVETPYGKTMSIYVDSNSTIGDIKNTIYSIEKIASDLQILIYDDLELLDQKLMSDYGIYEGSILKLELIEKSYFKIDNPDNSPLLLSDDLLVG